MDHGFYASFFKHREALVGKFNGVADLVEVVGQQFVAEIPRCAIHRPGLAALFIKTNTKSAALLTQITLSTRVHHVGMLHRAFINLWDVVRYNILMLHRMQRQVDPCHGAHFSGPQSPSIHHVFSDQYTLIRHDLPTSVRPRVGLRHHRVQFNLGSIHARGLGVGMSGAGGIQVAIQRVVQPAQNALDIGHRRDIAYFTRR